MGYIQCHVPVLPVLNMDDSLTFYRDVLGFEVAWVWDDNGYAAIRCGDVELHLDVQASFQPYRVHSYLFVQNIDEIYGHHAARGVDIVTSLERKPWGVREYSFRDINGHIFKVAQDDDE
ncbi:VOC family protein [Paenibacillus silviterrae]|uniref:VOC family protein n=1 Tax=Paenibacillus silviterrae TaxID=3242194 RepID=UPI002543B3B4|nr:VOC family protein [Paenibacillus chinjuensis]